MIALSKLLCNQLFAYQTVSFDRKVLEDINLLSSIFAISVTVLGT